MIGQMRRVALKTLRFQAGYFVIMVIRNQIRSLGEMSTDRLVAEENLEKNILVETGTRTGTGTGTGTDTQAQAQAQAQAHRHRHTHRHTHTHEQPYPTVCSEGRNGP